MDGSRTQSMAAGLSFKLFSIAYGANHTKTKQIYCIIVMFVQNIPLPFFKCLKSRGTKVKKQKQFETQIIPFILHLTQVNKYLMFLDYII